ncbi:MAG: anti-sigma factor antagonist [Pseudonocardiales bacterium]|jgi:anti-sigma B factor antagonist|nr:anti-sigma factor antagonist [Pseudonocardiales bacterium]
MVALSLGTQREVGRCVVSVAGDLDIGSVPSLRRVADAELASPDCSTLVLDVRELAFLDSTGIGYWVELRTTAEALGKSFSLESVPHSVRRLLTIGGLADLFGLDETPAGTGQ